MCDLLKQGERLDDLQFNNLFIIQNPQEYCFTSDGVALANFVKRKASARVVDLCSGSGVVGILVQGKINASEVVCVEIQPQLADMCQRSIEYNKLESKIKVINLPLQNIYKVIGNESFDIVVCNPPYKNHGLISQKQEIAIAKHEIKVTLEEIILEANKLLKFGGKFYIVNKEERLTDIMVLMRKYNIEPKVIKILPSTKGANIILIEGLKGGKSGITISL